MKHLSAIIAIAALLVGAACSGKSSGDNSASEDAESTSSHVVAANADSLFSFVAQQTNLGPRVPGSQAHAALREIIARRLEQYGAAVTLQDTTFRALDGKTYTVHNIMGSFNPDAPRAVLLLAHYDTRPTADEDPDPSRRHLPIDGANDGGSGVAVLFEIARLAHQLPANTGIDLLFLDYEDSGTTADDSSWAVGAQAWSASQMPSKRNYSFGILLDMVGGANATFPREYFSNVYAGNIYTKLRRSAVALGLADRFPENVGGAVNDDHIHVLAAGIPCVDIIECAHPDTGSFNPTWHTHADNLSNIDRNTLKAVTDVVLHTLSNL